MKPNLKKIADDNMSLLNKKSADYSRDNIQATGIEGIAARMMDKASRLLNLANKEGEPNFESLADTLQDIANYGLIGQAVAMGEWSRSTNLVYLAGPIDQISEEDAMGWRDYVGYHLASHGVTCFNPCSAFTIGKQPPSDLIRSINRHALASSHICLVNLTGKTSGFGTIREIEFARANGVRVIVAEQRGLANHLEAYDLEMVDSLDAAIFRIIGDE